MIKEIIRLHLGLCLFGLAILLAGCGTTKVPPTSLLITGNTHQKCLEILREGLNSNEFWPSIHAAEALIDAEYTFEVKPLLIQRLEAESDKRRIAGYARALLRTGYNQAIIELQDILLSDDLEAQVLAAEAMFRTGSIGDATILEQALDAQKNHRLQVYAAAVLTITDRANMIDLIRSALESDDPAARYVAADVIPILGNLPEDLPILIDKKDLANSDFEALYFVRALSVFGMASARKELLAFLSYDDPAIRSRAAYAMAETWHIDESDRLLAMLDDPTLAVRVRAAQALLTLSNPTSPYRFLGLR